MLNPRSSQESPIRKHEHGGTCGICTKRKRHHLSVVRSRQPAGNRHCQECGARLDQSPLPTAPRPAVQATPVSEQHLRSAGLLFVVIVIALLFNVFGGNGTASETTIGVTTTIASAITEPAVVDILDQQCDPDGLGSFTCINLTSGSDAEYQVNWEEIQDAEGNIVIKMFFRQPMIVTRIDWSKYRRPDALPPETIGPVV